MGKLPKGNGTESSTEDKLKALYILQQIDSNIDKIRTVRGELPMEVTDLEDEIAGLETRITNLEQELVQIDENIAKRKQATKDSQALIKKYESQQNKVKNNREYESIVKEIEYQNLEIQLAEKRIAAVAHAQRRLAGEGCSRDEHDERQRPPWWPPPATIGHRESEPSQ